MESNAFSENNFDNVALNITSSKCYVEEEIEQEDSIVLWFHKEVKSINWHKHSISLAELPGIQKYECWYKHVNCLSSLQDF